MLKLFIKECSENIVNLNDVYFNKYTFKRLKYNITYDIIKEIDGVELTKDFKIISKFTNSTLDLSKLSTGCKTILNILYHQETIFNISECGINALAVIYRMSVGNVYTKNLVTPIRKNIPCDIEIVSDKGIYKFTTVSDMRTWYGEVYLNEMETSSSK